MSPFDGADLFRACQLDISHGVDALQYLNEDSIQQYSKAQLQRHSQARQRIEQKDARTDKANDAEKIEATISEDTADGQTAKLDASLKFLSDDEIQLLIPSDELDDDEIHIIESKFNGLGGGSNHALQDYQMQLMLLEQQNKKRLLMARQEQDLSNAENASTAEELRYRTLYKKRLLNKKQAEVLVTSIPSTDCLGSALAPEMPPKRASAGNGSRPMRGKRGKGEQMQAAILDEHHHVVNGNKVDTEQNASVEVGVNLLP
jgi:hypothetical protein